MLVVQCKLSVNGSVLRKCSLVTTLVVAPFHKGAMALAGVGLAWPSQLDLREGGGPEHPTWIALVGWLDVLG